MPATIAPVPPTTTVLNLDQVTARLDLVFRATPTEDVFIRGTAAELLPETAKMGLEKFEKRFGKAPANNVNAILTDTLPKKISNNLFTSLNNLGAATASALAGAGTFGAASYLDLARDEQWFVLLFVGAFGIISGGGILAAMSGIPLSLFDKRDLKKTAAKMEHFFSTENLLAEEPAVLENSITETIERIDELAAHFQKLSEQGTSAQTGWESGNVTTEKLIRTLQELKSNYRETLQELRLRHTAQFLREASEQSLSPLETLRNKNLELRERFAARREADEIGTMEPARRREAQKKAHLAKATS